MVLLAEHAEVAARLQALITGINLANSTTSLADGRSLTAALAERDVLRLRHAALVKAAAAAVPGSARYSRTEIVSALDVIAVQREADDVAQRLRRLDLAVQEAGWKTEVALA